MGCGCGKRKRGNSSKRKSQRSSKKITSKSPLTRLRRVPARKRVVKK